MKRNIEPLYIPVKLQEMRRRLAEHVQRKKWVEMTLKPKPRGLLGIIKQWF